MAWHDGWMVGLAIMATLHYIHYSDPHCIWILIISCIILYTCNCQSNSCLNFLTTGSKLLDTLWLHFLLLYYSPPFPPHFTVNYFCQNYLPVRRSHQSVKIKLWKQVLGNSSFLSNFLSIFGKIWNSFEVSQYMLVATHIISIEV